jgi:hypothetical protein
VQGFAQKLTQGKARFRVPMAVPGFPLFGCKSQRRTAQRPRHIDFIAGARSITPQGSTPWNRSTDCDIANQPFAMGEIATCQHRARFTRQLQDPIEKTTDLPVGQPGRTAQRHEAKTGNATHGGDIAETAREGFSAQFEGFVRPAMKVDVFHDQIRGEEQIFDGASGPVDGAVVTDAENDWRTGRYRGGFPQPFGDGCFVLRGASQPEV